MALGALVVLFGVVIAGIFWWSGDAAKAGTAFFVTFAQDGPAAAYQTTSTAFRAKVTEAQLSHVGDVLRLREYKSISWSGRTIRPAGTELEGTLLLQDGTPIAMKVVMTDSDGWRLQDLDGHIMPPPLPDEAAAKALAARTLLALDAAFKSGDFAALHATLSKSMQAQFTTDALAQSFQEFVAQHADLSPAQDGANLAVQPAEHGPDGAVILRGTLTLPQRPLNFRFRYLSEGGVLKPLGLGLGVHPQ